MYRTIFIILILLFSQSVYSRHIDLDSLYINGESGLYKKLISTKELIYSQSGSRKIDTSVVFALWINGSEIVYIREFYPSNILYLYQHRKQERKELCRISGVITTVKTDPCGKFIYLKRLVGNSFTVPVGELIVLESSSGKIIYRKRSYPFLDFSITQKGNILHQKKDGIFDLNPVTNEEKLIYSGKLYSKIKRGDVSIACESPCGNRTLFLSGSGGAYGGLLVFSDHNYLINGITSCSEIFWIDSRRLVYRMGYTGNFKGVIYDILRRKYSVFVKNSLNTNLLFSRHAKMITYLKDGMIHAYDVQSGERFSTLLEGEDVFFSSDKNRFVSLYRKDLFLSSINILRRRELMVRRECRKILRLYKNIIKNKSIHENSYSADYIRRKISQYSSLESRTASDN